MKDASLALILGKMSAPRARQITVLLAQIDESRAFAQTPETAAVPAPPPVKTPPPNQSANNLPKTKAPPAATGATPSTPNAPNVPTPKAPNAPNAPKTDAKAASGQAPADPKQ